MKGLVTFFGGMLTSWIASTEEGKEFANKAMSYGFKLAKEKLLPQVTSFLSSNTDKKDCK